MKQLLGKLLLTTYLVGAPLHMAYVGQRDHTEGGCWKASAADPAKPTGDWFACTLLVGGVFWPLAITLPPVISGLVWATSPETLRSIPRIKFNWSSNASPPSPTSFPSVVSSNTVASLRNMESTPTRPSNPSDKPQPKLEQQTPRLYPVPLDCVAISSRDVPNIPAVGPYGAPCYIVIGGDENLGGRANAK